MPKTIDEAADSAESAKPKRKYVRKTKTSAPMDGVDSSVAPAVPAAPVTPITESVPAEASLAAAAVLPVASAMEDIKPKPASVELIEPEVPTTPPPVVPVQTVQRDAKFLTPDNYNFGLKDKAATPVTKSSGWAKRLTFILGVLIILMALALGGLYYYSNKLAKEDQPTAQTPVASTDNSNSKPAAATSTVLKFGSANIPASIKDNLLNAIKTKFNFSLDTAPTTGVTADVDTLFVKSSAKAQATDVIVFLADRGINAQVQESTSIADDMVLFLTSNLKNVDLSKYTATSNNATKTGGLAKKYCDILKIYKISACTAANSPTSATGLSVLVKDTALLNIIPRLTEFKSATVQQASSSQVEDIKVIIGK